MGDLLPCPFCGGSAKISTRTDECIWSHDQVEWTAVSCSGGPDFDCLQPSVDWPTSATDENDTQLSISQWNRRALPAAPAEDVRAGADLAPIDVGGVGNYYGGLMIMAKDGQPFWCIENWDGCDWQPCPIEVFTALRALIPGAKP